MKPNKTGNTWRVIAKSCVVQKQALFQFVLETARGVALGVQSVVCCW